MLEIVFEQQPLTDAPFQYVRPVLESLAVALPIKLARKMLSSTKKAAKNNDLSVLAKILEI